MLGSDSTCEILSMVIHFLIPYLNDKTNNFMVVIQSINIRS